jgi:hypothetical protein
MHLFDVTLSTLQRRNRAAFVPADAEVELWPGEKVVLRDQDGEYFAGTVVGSVDQPEAHVHVHVGVRMPEEYAVRRLERDRQLDDVLAHILGGGLDELDEEAEEALDDELEICGPAMVGDVEQLLDLLGDAREALAARTARQLVRDDVAREVREGAAVVVSMPSPRLA